MKKGLKRIILMAMVGVLSIGGTTSLTSNAENLKTNTEVRNEVLEEMMEKSPNLKKHIEENTNGQAISISEEYVKFTKKPNVKLKENYTKENIEEDIIVTSHTKEEYLKEINSKWEDTATSSWLRISTQVFRDTNSPNFMAYNFSSWLKSPFFRYKDGISLALSDGIVIGPSPAFGEYIAGTYQHQFYNPLFVEINDKGALAQAHLNESVAGWVGEYHNMMIGIPIEFNNPNIVSGRVFGSYLHKEVGVGGLSLGSNGFPSPSITAKYSETKVSTYFKK